MIRLLAAMVGALAASAFCGASFAGPRPSVEVFAQPDAFRDLALSEDGSRIAIITQRDSADVIQVFNTDRLAAGPMADYRLGPARSVRWIGWKGRRLVFGVSIPDRSLGFLVEQTRMMSTDEHLQVFLNLGQKPNQAAETPQFQDSVASFLPADANAILVAIDWVDPLHPGLMRIDPRDASTTRVLGRGRGVQDWLVDADGTPRIAFGDPVQHKPALFEVGPGGVLTALEPNDDSFKPLAFDTVSNSLIVASSHDDGVLGLYAYSLKRHAFTKTLFKDNHFDVSDVLLSPDGRRVVGARYVDDRSHDFYFDESAKARARRVAELTGAEDAVILAQTADGRFVVAGERENGRVTKTYWLDLSAGEARPFLPFHPALEHVAFGRTFSVTFKARDGADIPGYVTLPPGLADLGSARDLPFVVMPHGGPETRDDMEFDWWAQFVATRGFAVFQPNFRGSAGYGQAFREVAERAWATVAMNDVTDGARWLVAQGYADAGRMCVVGWSFGGYLALEAAVEDGALFKCASSTAGVSDLPGLIDSEGEFYGGTLASRQLFGDLRRDRAKLNNESPLRHIESISMPVLLIHGAVDQNVPVEQSRRMKARLSAANKPVQYMEFPLADHSFRRQTDRLGFLKALEAFLDANLGFP